MSRLYSGDVTDQGTRDENRQPFTLSNFGMFSAVVNMLIGWSPKAASRDIASTRFRCLEPLKWINENEALVQNSRAMVFKQGAENLYGGMVFNKNFYPKAIALAATMRERKGWSVFDICDNLSLRGDAPRGRRRDWNDLRYMMDTVDALVFSTPALQEIYAPYICASKQQQVIADPVDIYPNFGKRETNGRIRLLWFGSWGVAGSFSGIRDLRKLVLPISELARKGYDAELRVVSNDFDLYRDVCSDFPIPTSYGEWGIDTFQSELEESDLVVLPVTQNDFTIGKSNNRLTLPLAHGVPVLADAIPSYREFPDFLIQESWGEDLVRVIANLEDYSLRASAARSIVEKKYSIEAIGPQWAALLNAQIESHL